VVVARIYRTHLAQRFAFQCTKPITANDALGNSIRKLQTGLRYALFRDGPLVVGVMIAAKAASLSWSFLPVALG